MPSNKSFIVLALSAAYAAANLCTPFFPPQDNSSSGSSNNNTSNDSGSGGSGGANDSNDSPANNLCKEPDTPLNETWSDVQSDIDDLKTKIDTKTSRKADIQKTCDDALTEWKKLYPFECPATKPTYDDYKSFIPSLTVRGFSADADKKIQQAKDLELDAEKEADRIGEIEGERSKLLEIIETNEKELGKFRKFKTYWNANGADYTKVNEFY